MRLSVGPVAAPKPAGTKVSVAVIRTPGMWSLYTSPYGPYNSRFMIHAVATAPTRAPMAKEITPIFSSDSLTCSVM